MDILRNDVDIFPTDYGIYNWIYWPEFDADNISPSKLKDLLINFSKADFQFEEDLTGLYKFRAKIWEQGYRDNKNIFGLADSASLELELYLQDRDNIRYFSGYFQLVCFARPFYLGKGNDLRGRIKNHLKGRTPVLPEIISKGIPEQEIWVGYKKVQAPSGGALNTIFEEIYTRRIKPGLTKKPN